MIKILEIEGIVIFVKVNYLLHGIMKAMVLLARVK